MPVNYAGTASDQRIALLENAAVTGPWIPVAGGSYTFAVWGGTWGGATAKLQWYSETSGLVKAFDVQGITATTDWAMAGLPLGSGYARCVITGGTGVSLSATLSGITN